MLFAMATRLGRFQSASRKRSPRTILCRLSPPPRISTLSAYSGQGRMSKTLLSRSTSFHPTPKSASSLDLRFLLSPVNPFYFMWMPPMQEMVNWMPKQSEIAEEHQMWTFKKLNLTSLMCTCSLEHQSTTRWMSLGASSPSLGLHSD